MGTPTNRIPLTHAAISVTLIGLHVVQFHTYPIPLRTQNNLCLEEWFKLVLMTWLISFCPRILENELLWMCFQRFLFSFFFYNTIKYYHLIVKWNASGTWWWWWLFPRLRGFWENIRPSFQACDSFSKVEISSCTLIPPFRPVSVHSGSVSWDDCSRTFPGKLCVSWQVVCDFTCHHARLFSELASKSG